MYAIIENGIVVNTVEADNPLSESWVLIPSGETVSKGWLYQNSQFVQPEKEPIEPIEPTPEPRHITRLAFLNRFTIPESVAIDLASQGTTTEAAYVRVYMRRVEAASFIDLERQDTRDGVMAMELQGVLAEGRALEILDNEIEEIEKYKG